MSEEEKIQLGFIQQLAGWDEFRKSFPNSDTLTYETLTRVVEKLVDMIYEHSNSIR